jgi:hypothetical protein
VAVARRANPETVAALLDTTWRVVESERDRTDALDRKAAALASFASLVLSLIAILSREFVRHPGRYLDFALFVLSLASLVLAVGVAVEVPSP